MAGNGSDAGFEVIISSDSHVMEPPDLWLNYLEAKYRHRAIRVERGADGVGLFRTEVPFLMRDLGAVAAQVLRPMLDNVVRVLAALDCDLVLLSGGGAHLPAVTELILEGMPLRPDRVVCVHQHRFAPWFPPGDAKLLPAFEHQIELRNLQFGYADAPVLHEDMPLPKTVPPGMKNVCGHMVVNVGDAEKAMAEAGVEPDRTVMIGDTAFDMEMGRNAGVGTIGVTWGYHPRDRLRAAGAHQMIDHGRQLLAAIDRQLSSQEHRK